MAEEKPPIIIPDPTIQTQERIEREVGNVHTYVNAKFDTLAEKLRGIDKATEVLDVTMNRFPTDTQKAIGCLENVVNEKFNAVDLQFKERDTRQERESRDTKVAVDVALTAQKEALLKQGDSLTKELENRIQALDNLTDTKFVTLKTVVEANAAQVALALDASEKAITKAETATDKRFESVNEFRATLSDLSDRMATRRELEQSLTEIKGILTEHAKQLAEYRSRLDTGPTGLTQLQNQYAALQGSKQGSDLTIGKIYAAIGVVGTILGILVLLANGVFN